MKIKNRWIKSDSKIYEFAKDTVESVESNFDIRRFHSAEGYDVVIDENEEQRVLIQSHTNPINDTKDDKKIHVPVESIMKRGSIVYLPKYDEKWLVLSKVDKLLAYNSAQIYWCNYNLQWVDKYGVLQEEPAVVKNRVVSSTGILENDNLIMPDGKYFIYMPDDEKTRELYRDFRFIIDRYPYRITRIDRLNRRGVCEIFLQEDTKHHLDDIENEIAYNDLANYEVIAENNAVSLRVGYAKSIKYKVLKDGKIDNSVEVLFESSNPDVVTIDESGEILGISEGNADLSISIKNNPSINTTIQVKIEQTTSNNYYISISPNLASVKINYEKTFTVTKYNNEDIITGNFEISIDESTTASPSDYEFSTIENTFTIKNNNDNYEYVAVKIVDLDGNVEDKIIEYQLVGIFG